LLYRDGHTDRETDVKQPPASGGVSII